MYLEEIFRLLGDANKNEFSKYKLQEYINYHRINCNDI